MKCPECDSQHIRKNGIRRGKQNHLCVNCGRQFVENPKTYRGYSDDVRRICLRMYVNGMGLRAISRVTGIHHTTVLNWIKQVSEILPNAYDPEVIPQVGELDELQTFVGKKKIKSGFGRQSTISILEY
jgi:hypothetical protein